MPPPSLFCRTTSSISSPRRFHIKIDLLPSHRRAQSAPCLQLCAAVAAAIPVHHRLRRAQPWSMASTDPLYLCRQPPRPMIRLSLSLSCSVEQSYKKKMKRDLHGWRKKKRNSRPDARDQERKKKMTRKSPGAKPEKHGKNKEKKSNRALTRVDSVQQTAKDTHGGPLLKPNSIWAHPLFTGPSLLGPVTIHPPHPNIQSVKKLSHPPCHAPIRKLFLIPKLRRESHPNYRK